MRIHVLTIGLGIGLLGLQGCVADAPETNTAADIEAINEVREREFKAISAGDVDQFVAIFSSDAVVMPPGAPTLTGVEAIRTWAQGMVDQFTVGGVGYTGSHVDVMGDWAVERYTGSLELTAAGSEPIVESVRGIHVYRRQPDGSWLITHDVWNSEAPAPGGQ